MGNLSMRNVMDDSECNLEKNPLIWGATMPQKAEGTFADSVMDTLSMSADTREFINKLDNPSPTVPIIGDNATLQNAKNMPADPIMDTQPMDEQTPEFISKVDITSTTVVSFEDSSYSEYPASNVKSSENVTTIFGGPDQFTTNENMVMYLQPKDIAQDLADNSSDSDSKEMWETVDPLSEYHAAEAALEDKNNHSDVNSEPDSEGVLLDEDQQNDLQEFIQDFKDRPLSIFNSVSTELRKLESLHYKQKRDAKQITHELISEVQKLLELFGMPFVTAPMEAEAQCAYMSQKRIVDGIFTDDSDTLLFGGGPVYRHVFSKHQSVEKHDLETIRSKLGYDREDLITYAYLVGSDYTLGIKGVGIMNAKVIMKNFRGYSGLEKFKEWSRKFGQEETDLELQKLRKISERLEIPEHFPDLRIKDAYLDPVIDTKHQTYTWGSPQKQRIVSFMSQWVDQDKVTSFL
jgi:DNA excision repair protein ERCC-5